MCIAIIKPSGVKAPSKKILKECWNNNPNGAGFCYNNGKQVVIHKGFMSFKEFYNAYRKLDYTDKDLIIHFRIATHGGVNKECTHPFKISTDINELKKLDTTCKSAFIHNGIISGYGSYKDNGTSDTMEYVTKIIANIPQMSATLLDNLAKEKNSRFAILYKNKFLFGGTWLEDNGIYYSNSSYKPKPKVTVVKTYYNNNRLPLLSSSYAKKCEWCGETTYLPRTIHDYKYNESYQVCGNCYTDYLEMREKKEFNY